MKRKLHSSPKTIKQEVSNLASMLTVDPQETLEEIMSQKKIEDKNVQRRNAEHINKVIE